MVETDSPRPKQKPANLLAKKTLDLDLDEASGVTGPQVGETYEEHDKRIAAELMRLWYAKERGDVDATRHAINPPFVMFGQEWTEFWEMFGCYYQKRHVFI